MKPIIARDQARLGAGRCVRLAVSGMSYRLLRSGITTAILALAVTFLVHVLTHAILAERIQRSAWNALEPTREATAMFARLAAPDSIEKTLERLAISDEEALREAQLWAGGDDESWQVIPRSAEGWLQTRGWFETLGPSDAAVLLEGQRFTDWLNGLEDDGQRRAFNQRVQQLGLARSWADQPGNAGEAALTQWSRLREAVETIREGHRRAILRFGAADERPLLERFAQPHPELPRQLTEAGFEVSPSQQRNLSDFANFQAELAAIRQTLDDQGILRAVNQSIGNSEFDAVMQALVEPNPAWWYDAVGQSTATHAPNGGVVPVARRYLEEQRLAAVIQGYEPVVRDTLFGLTAGTLWLVGLSLLVCVVGVTNALLMSVTERFNEIATMKCLGAMDRSIMQMFVAEAVIQGVLGGAVGVVIGLLLTLVRGFTEFGTLMFRGFEGWTQLLSAAALSLGIGVLLAALAAVGPSWIASRLAPMEAMRVE